MHKMVVENLILIFRVEMSLFYFESIYTYFLCITEITAITNVQPQIQVYFNKYISTWRMEATSTLAAYLSFKTFVHFAYKPDCRFTIAINCNIICLSHILKIYSQL